MKNINNIISALLISLGISVAGFFIYSGIKYFKNFDRFVEVKGLAEKLVKSNLATWNINFTVSGDDLKSLYQKINDQQKIILSFLTSNGFSREQIQLVSPSVTDNFANQYSNNNNNKLPHYQILSVITITSNEVDLIAKISQNTGEFINQGIIITSSFINYFYTNLNNIKAQMLDDATKNAKAAAQTFASNANSHIGKIKNASQGTFTITSVDGTATDDIINLNKKVRVVTSIKYFLN